MPKRKVTPFARFLLAMIIIVPLAFAGASYINGEDPIQNFEQMTGIELQKDNGSPQSSEAEAQTKTTETEATTPAQPQNTEALQRELKELREQLQQRDRAIDDLQQQLKDCQ